MNATQAAIRAGYSARTAQEKAARLLSNVMVQTQIEQLMADRSERCVDADEVLQLAHALSSSNVFTVFDAVRSGKTDNLPESVQRTVKSIKHKRIERKDEFTEEITITMHDKVQPLTLLWKHLGLLHNDAEAIATLQTYGKVTKTDTGFWFEYVGLDG